jgi:hypothetical protein
MNLSNLKFLKNHVFLKYRLTPLCPKFPKNLKFRLNPHYHLFHSNLKFLMSL